MLIPLLLLLTDFDSALPCLVSGLLAPSLLYFSLASLFSLSLNCFLF